MNELLNNNSFNYTLEIVLNNPISSIPYDEQILIDGFNSYIQIGIGSILFIFGLTFNCLSLFYFHLSRSFRHTTFRLYFSLISILDTIRLFEFLIFILFDKGYLKVTLTLCRSIFFTIMFTGQGSIWLTVALTIEKCIIILFPIKGRLCFTMSISKLILILVLILVLLSDIIYLLPNFFLHTYENVSIHTFMCVWQKDSQSSENSYDQWKKHYFTFNTVFFHSIIPSIILIILNGLILSSLSHQRIILTKIGSIDSKNILKREKQFKEKTIQLVLSSFFLIITISPRYILTMINAFATNISKTPIMPLYIYVNLNTIFRVLEMCNYSLNISFAILSGRTSRLEIRKLFWEYLFWRCKRIEVNQEEMKYEKNLFLFDDDNDHHHIDCSIQPQQSISYNPIKNQLSNHYNYLTPKSSYGNYSLQQQHQSTNTSLFTCCGFTIDLSHNHPYSLNSKSTLDDSSTRRSTMCKNSNISRKSFSSKTFTSSNDGMIRQQKTVCYRSTNLNRPITRRRATTVVHCTRNTPVSSIHRTISKEKQSSSIINSISIKEDQSTNILQTDYLESSLNASIIQTS